MTLRVEAPAVTPTPYGLLSAVPVVEVDDPHMGFGVEYDSVDCIEASLTAWECLNNPAIPPITGGDGGFKDERDGIPNIEGEPFTVYRLHTCRTVGRWADAVARAEAAFPLAEARAVDRGLTIQIEARTPDVTSADLGTNLDITAALGRLETVVAATYGGRATILMNRQAATALFAKNLLWHVGNHIETYLGTPVAILARGGTATPDGINRPAGQTVLVALGGLVLWRGPMTSTGPTLGDTPRTNVYSVLTERTYVPTWECVTAWITTSTTDCCPTVAPTVAPTGENPVLTSVYPHTNDLVGPVVAAPPPGNIQQVTISIVKGTAIIDGNPITAPREITFDADTDEILVLPSISLAGPTDEAFVSWVSDVP